MISPRNRVGRLREAWWIRGAVIGVALLALATGFCLFDRDEAGAGGHVPLPDLCLLMLAVSLAVMPLARPLAVGWAVDLRVTASHAMTLRIPDPPPRSAHSFSL